MPTFQYTAFGNGGDRVVGVVAGANEQAVLAELARRDLTPISVKVRKEARRALRGVSARALGNAYLQLGDLVRAGVPIVRGLKLLGRRRSNPRLAEVFRQLGDAISEGETLADAMAARPDVFSRVHIAMIRAGEAGGFLEDVLVRLGELVIGQADIRAKVVGNMIYPAILVLVGIAILVVVSVFFVPMFMPVFDRLPDLPMVTKIVFAVSTILTEYGVIAAGLVGAALFALWRWTKRPKARRTVTRLVHRTPAVGPLVKALAAARFCRMMGTMLRNGVPILQAMRIARDAAGDVLLEDAIEQAAEAVQKGEQLAPPLGTSGLFEDDVVEMIAVGEEAANLDAVLENIAETIERRVDRLLTTAVRLIEPLMLLLIAGVVAIVAMGLVLPMFQMSSAI